MELKYVMVEFLSENLNTIVGFITGGGLLSVITAVTTKKQAQRQAMREIQTAYQETIKDLRMDKVEMKKENEELRKQVDELRKEFNALSLELAAIKTYKCTKLSCQNRKTTI